MPEIERKKDSTEQEITVRFIQTSPVEPVSVDASTPGLNFWYRREDSAKVAITPVDKSSLTAAHTPGGIISIGDGYHNLDIPDAAFASGVDNVMFGGSADGIVMIGVYVRLKDKVRSVSSSGVSGGASFAVDCTVLLPEAAVSTHNGCDILTKRRHVPVAKGLCGTVVWTMRNSSGLAADFSECLTEESISESDSVSTTAIAEEIKVRFQGCDRGCLLAEVDGEIVDATAGLIEFPLPEIVCQNAGIYQFQAALVRDDAPIFIDGGLISVEHGMWGDYSNMLGPPTIQEIRFHLRDRALENDLLRDVEFDDAEILEAIRWPVMQFNETPPPLKNYNCNSFPFRYYWLNAIVGRLLMTAVHHYVRNKMNAAGQGLAIDDKNKNDDYLRIAKLYADQWEMFIREKKAQLNASLAWGTVY